METERRATRLSLQDIVARLVRMEALSKRVLENQKVILDVLKTLEKEKSEPMQWSTSL